MAARADRGGDGLQIGAQLRVDPPGDRRHPITLLVTEVDAAAAGPVLIVVMPVGVEFKANGAPIYSTYLGGDGYDEGYGIAVDSRGQVYVTGVTESYDFPIKNAVQPVFNGFGEFDAFVAKLSADGRTLHYSTYLGGGKDDFGMGIAVDRLGQAYVTGYTYSADFPIKNAVQPVCGDSGDYASNTFITQLSADGSTLRYSTCLERE